MMNTAKRLIFADSPICRGARYLLFAALLAVIAGSLTPSDRMPDPVLRDKILHFGGYAVLATLALFAIRHPSQQAWSMFTLVLLGVVLEFGQLFVAGRSFELADMAANGTGVLAAFCVHRMGADAMGLAQRQSTAASDD